MPQYYFVEYSYFDPATNADKKGSTIISDGTGITSIAAAVSKTKTALGVTVELVITNMTNVSPVT